MPQDLYAEGVRIATGFMDLDGPNVNPACHTRLYTRGRRTERALVLLHGFTNCPQQFDVIGRQFHDRGWNVLIPRYPRHGYTDRLNTSVAELRSEHLLALASQSARAAHALGEHVTVAGLSLGGSLAGHLAQSHDHIDRAVLIAPMLGLQRIPGPLHPAIGRLALMAPNFYVWWDPRIKDRLAPTYGYPRYSTHAYAALLTIAAGVMRAARNAPPKTKHMAVVTNASELATENRFAYQLGKAWRAHGAEVATHEFPQSDHLPHDLIDPGNADQNTDLVYPVITRLITG